MLCLFKLCIRSSSAAAVALLLLLVAVNDVLVAATIQKDRSIGGDTLLNSYPMIMSHDAATGELLPQRDHIVAEWAKTQSAGLVQQLDCGSRSFDYRPYLDSDGVLYAHHGGVVIRKPMGESIAEVKQWCHEHPEELVIFYITSCEKASDDDDNSGDRCLHESKKLLKQQGVAIVDDCSDLKQLTFDGARELATLSDDNNSSSNNSISSSSSSGGSLLAIIECTDSNYDEENTCYGKGYICYDSWPEGTMQQPWQYMIQYLRDTTAAANAATTTRTSSIASSTATTTNATTPTTIAVASTNTVAASGSGGSHNMWTTQALWQSTAYTVAAGALHNSSLLLDQRRSLLNQWILRAVQQKFFGRLNYLELNDVCDCGNDIRSALLENYLLQLQK